MKYYKNGMVMLALMASLNAHAQHNNLWVEGFSNPESVIQHGSKLYVSNIGATLEPQKKDGDGFISKVDYKTGKLEDLHYLPLDGKLNAPKGSAFLGDVLYVADIDRIVGFDIHSRKTVFELAIPDATFLNDVVAVKDKLYVSATDLNTIFEVDVQQKKVQALADVKVPGANGLSYDAANDRLYCVGLSEEGQTPTGKVYAIDLKQGKAKLVPGYEGLLDGTAIRKGKLYFSDWKAFSKAGVLETLDLKSGRFEQVPLPEPVAGPADFTISLDQQYLLIPVMLEGKLWYWKL